MLHSRLSSSSVHKIAIVEPPSEARDMLAETLGDILGPDFTVGSFDSIRAVTERTAGMSFVLVARASCHQQCDLVELVVFMESHLDIPVILTTKDPDQELATWAMGSVIRDVIAVPAELDLLPPAIISAAASLNGAETIIDDEYVSRHARAVVEAIAEVEEVVTTGIAASVEDDALDLDALESEINALVAEPPAFSDETDPDWIERDDATVVVDIAAEERRLAIEDAEPKTDEMPAIDEVDLDPIVAPASEPHRARVTTVFSTKGGIGKTVVATNLAVTLARNSVRPVVLLDADLQFGDVSISLQTVGLHTIVDAIKQIDKLDEALLQGLLVKHEPSGLFILPAPLEPSFADQVTGADMARLIDILSEFAEHIVIDTTSHLDEVTINVLEKSDDIIFVAGMDVPAVKDVKVGLQVLHMLGIPDDRIRLLINRANSRVRLEVKEVEKSLSAKAHILMPSDILVPNSVNNGCAAVLESPKSGVAKSMRQLAALVARD